MIDAHHHIWRQKDLPWLLGPEQPRIFGAYAPIKRDYLIGEFLADVSGTGIEKSVYVQANWAPNWAADDSPTGVDRSAGMMVNYVYRLDEIEKNHEAYFADGQIAASSTVRKLAKR